MWAAPESVAAQLVGRPPAVLRRLVQLRLDRPPAVIRLAAERLVAATRPALVVRPLPVPPRAAERSAEPVVPQLRAPVPVALVPLAEPAALVARDGLATRRVAMAAAPRPQPSTLELI
jgi:hypothetical protein